MNEAEQQEFLEESEDFKEWFEDYEKRRDVNSLELVSQTVTRLYRLIDNLDRRLREIEQKVS